METEVYDRKSKTPWHYIAERVATIEAECFGAEAYTPQELAIDFNKRTHISILLWDRHAEAGEEYLVGYTQAEPKGGTMGGLLKSATYYIANTAIDPAYQNRGLVRLLLEALYTELRFKGVLYIERDAAIAQGYADSLVRIHAADVLETHDHDSQYGPQRFIRMKVPRA